jgi:branched-chain amino acid transport system substrate-binding protein
MSDEKKISRRGFIKGAAVGVVAAGLAAGIGGYLGGVSVGKGQVVTATETETVATTQTQTVSPTGTQQILVGQSTQLTGPEGALGTQSQWANQYEINKINNLGGIYVKELGYQLPVKYMVLDDKSDIATSVANMNTLATQDSVNYFLGSGGSVTTSQDQVAITRNMLYIGGALDSPDEWSKAGTETFGVFIQLKGTGGPTSITPLFNWVDSLPSGSRPQTVAVWEDDSVEGDAMCGPSSDIVTQASNHGLSVVFQQKYETGTSDYTSLIEATKATNPDIVVGIPVPPDAITMVKQSAQLGFAPKLWYLHKGLSFQQVLEAMGPAAAGLTMPTAWSPSLPIGQDVAAVWEQQNKSTPSWLPILMSVPTDVLWQAIQIAGSLDTSKVANALHTNTFYTTIGPVKFGPDGSFYPPTWIQQCIYNKTANSFGEHVSYKVGNITYPATGCCTT